MGGRYTQTATSVSSSAATIVWTNTVFERGGGTMSNGIYTVGPAGLYVVAARIRVAATYGSNHTINLQIEVDTVGMLLHLPRATSGATDMTAMVDGLLELAAGAAVRVRVSSEGTGISLPNNGSDTYFSIVKVG